MTGYPGPHQKKKGAGSIFVISAPSGAGKSTLCSRLLATVELIRPSVSFTTRPPRKGEVNNVDYSFVTERQFQRRIDAGEFVEWASVHGNLYGTSRKRLGGLIKSGVDVLLDIDVQGAEQIRKSLDGCVYIFILPPSLGVLKERLTRRMSGTKEQPRDIERRLAKARSEMKHYKQYDYVIVNDNLETAQIEFEAIITAQRLLSRRVDTAWVRKNLFKQEEP